MQRHEVIQWIFALLLVADLGASAIHGMFPVINTALAAVIGFILACTVP